MQNSPLKISPATSEAREFDIIANRLKAAKRHVERISDGLRQEEDLAGKDVAGDTGFDSQTHG